MSKVEVLVATMHQNNLSKYKEMNIQTNATLANQADIFEYKDEIIDGNTIKMITTCYRGVGKNRNVALINASAEICMFGDDDMIYVDNYEKTVIEAFDHLPDADIIIFNIGTKVESLRRKNQQISRVYLYNFMNYGTARIAFRRDRIISKNIWFTLLFGGGSKYGSGEDSLFLREALKKGLKIYTYPFKIADLKDNPSTWFSGYNEKFFFDKGAFLELAFPVLKYLIALYFVIRFNKLSSITYFRIFYLLINGMKAFRKGISFDQWEKSL